MFTVAALYRFARFEDPASLRGPLLDACRRSDVRGTLLLAQEGINGTIAGTRAGIDAVLAHIRTLPGCADLDWKEAGAASIPFGRMKVRLKREIVTMGVGDLDPAVSVGTYVEASDWNRLIERSDVVLIDTRNDYEVGIGTFRGAIDPGLRTFREFPAWWRAHAEDFRGKRVAMFCTGGIRCEKSTSFLRSEGVEEVFHLRGGILKYLEEIPESQSRWQGGCFVFDRRVSVGHGLTSDGHTLCHACRRPLDAEDRRRPEYEEGAACHHCIGDYDERKREGFRERHRQFRRLAAQAEGG
jgi:UPF0176 protein